MSGSYRISATPVLYTAGAFKGKLKGVSFTSASPTDTHEWYANNCGHFELAFSRIMPRTMAQALVASLTQSDEVELPGLYAEHEFEGGFLFEWSPVHFILPVPDRPREYAC